MFNHVQTPTLVPKLKSQSQNEFRYYSVDGKSYPFVTSVLSILSKDGIRAWRDSIGHDVADFETRRAATRGIIFIKYVKIIYLTKIFLNTKKNSILWVI